MMMNELPSERVADALVSAGLKSPLCRDDLAQLVESTTGCDQLVGAATLVMVYAEPMYDRHGFRAIREDTLKLLRDAMQMTVTGHGAETTG
jgi:hypothetical protein